MCHTAWSMPMSGTTVVTPLDVCGSRHPRPLEPAFDLRLGRRPPGPRLLIYHHGLAGLDRLVHLEEVPNLELQKAVQVGDVLEVRQPVVAGRHAQHLGRRALLIAHAEQADRAAEDDAAR